MELVRYKPGEAIRWLQTGAQKSRKEAKAMGNSLAIPQDTRALGDNLKTAAGALMAAGRGALADLAHQQAAATEFVLDDTGFEVLSGSSARRIAYSEIRRIDPQGDRFTFYMERSTLLVKPYAYVVSGRLKVPIGWSRNGLEVPFELLVEELAARCGIDLD
jgi:hypothetical protein